jgi:hypothetical protein
MMILADIGATALYLLFIWLGAAIVCSLLSDWKGYGEKPGLATGLLLSAAGILVWLALPPRPDSRWKERRWPWRERARRNAARSG